MDFRKLVGDTDIGSSMMGKAGDTAAQIGMGDKGLFPSLTMKQRVYGFGICFMLGILFSVIVS